MAPRKNDSLQLTEMFRDLQEGIRASAVSPNILAYKPHPKQEEFHRATTKGRLYIGGNRGGKTVGGATESIWWCSGTHPYQRVPRPPIRGRCISVDFTNGVEAIVKPEVKRWIAPSMLINGSWEDSYNTNTRTLTFSNGSFLEFKSYDQDLDKHAGTSRHFVWFDEEPPHAIFEENMMRLIDTDGRWWLTMTPVEGYTWTAEELYEPALKGQKEIYVVQVDMLDNPYLNHKSIEEAMSHLSPEDREARQKGIYVMQGGLIFKKFRGDIHVREDMMFDPRDPNVRFYASMDHGINNATAWLWHLVHDDGTVFTFKEHYQADWTIRQHVREIKKIEYGIGRIPELRVGDPSIKQRETQTGLSNQIAYSQLGIYIAPANNNIDAGIAKMQDYLYWDEKTKPKWYIHDSCYNLIKEMRKYRWKEWDSRKLKDKNNKREQPHQKDDHAIDSARYLFSFLPDLKREQVKEDKRRLNEQIAAQLRAVPSVDLMAPRIDTNLLSRPRVHTEWNEIDDGMH